MITTAAFALFFASLGALAGGLHLALVARQIHACVSGGASAFLALIRFPTTAAAFVLAAREGWPMLAAALAGFLLVRALLIRRPEILIR